MPGFLTWASDKIQQTYNSAQTTYNLYVKGKLEKTYNGAVIAYNATGSAISGTFKFLSPYHFGTGLKNAWTGSTRVVDPETSSFILNAPKTRNLLWQSFYADASYVLMHALYAGPVKNTLRNLPVVNNYFVETTLDMTASAVIYSLWMFLNGRYKENPPENLQGLLKDMLPSATSHRLWLEMAATNSINGVTLATLASAENDKLLQLPQHQKRKVMYNANCNQPYKPCKHFISSKLQAKAYAFLEWLSEQAAIYVISKIPYVGPGLATALEWISMGKLLMRYKLDDMCLADQNEILYQNNMFAFGFGASFSGANKLITSSIINYAGMKDYESFVRYGVTAFLSQWFVMLAILQGRRYPGTGAPRDIFYLAHWNMYELLRLGGLASTSVMNFANRLFYTPNPTSDWRQQVKDIVESKYFGYGLKALPRDMQTLEALLRSPSVYQWFDVHTQKFRDLSAFIKRTRTVPLASSIPTLTNYTPRWILGNKMVRYFLGFFFGKDAEDVIIEFENDLNFIRRIQLKDYSGKDVPPPPPPVDKKEEQAVERTIAAAEELIQQIELMKSQTKVEIDSANLPAVETPKAPEYEHRIDPIDNYDPNARRKQALFQPKPRESSVVVPANLAPRAGMNTEA